MPGVISEETARALRVLVWPTLAYFVLYFTFLCFQSFTKLYILSKQKKKDSKTRMSLREIKYGEASKKGLALLSDRTFLNMHEQSVAILLPVWLQGCLVSPTDAAYTLWFYIAFRALYPFAFRKGVPWILFSTFPNYVAIMYSTFRIASYLLSL